MSWLIELLGSEAGVKDVREAVTGTPWFVLDLDGSHFLGNAELDDLSDAEEFESRAAGFLETLTGALRLLYRDHRPTRLGGMSRLRADGRRTHYITPEPITSTMRVYAPSIGPANAQPPPSPAVKWLARAHVDAAVNDALRFFRDPTWTNLYKVFEVIRSDVGGMDALRRSGLVDVDLLRRFTGTAQSRYYLGDHARHAVERSAPIADPITIDEAQELIQLLIRNWLAMKAP